MTQKSILLCRLFASLSAIVVQKNAMNGTGIPTYAVNTSRKGKYCFSETLLCGSKKTCDNAALVTLHRFVLNLYSFGFHVVLDMHSAAAFAWFKKRRIYDKSEGSQKYRQLGTTEKVSTEPVPLLTLQRAQVTSGQQRYRAQLTSPLGGKHKAYKFSRIALNLRY